MALSKSQETILSKLSKKFTDMKSLSQATAMQQPTVRTHVRALEKLGLVICKNPIHQGEPLMARNPNGKEPLVFKGILSHQGW